MHLTAHQPKRISFPVPIRVGVPSHLPMQAEVRGEHLWLTGNKRLDSSPARLLVQSLTDERQWVLEVIISSERHKAEPTPPLLLTDKTPQKEPHWLYIELARWGWQQLFSPRRLLQTLPGTQRVAVGREAVALTRCRPDTGCLHTRAVPLAAWRNTSGAGGNTWLTAISLTNLGESAIRLSAQMLLGEWLAVSFSTTQLAEQAAADNAHTGTALLLSAAPFHQSLKQ